MAMRTRRALIGVDSDWSRDLGEPNRVILTSVVKDLGPALFNQAAALASGTWQGGVVWEDLASGATDIGLRQDQPAGPRLSQERPEGDLGGHHRREHPDDAVIPPRGPGCRPRRNSGTWPALVHPSRRAWRATAGNCKCRLFARTLNGGRLVNGLAADAMLATYVRRETSSTAAPGRSSLTRFRGVGGCLGAVEAAGSR